jgi:hypothetical protein
VHGQAMPSSEAISTGLGSGQWVEAVSQSAGLAGGRALSAVMQAPPASPPITEADLIAAFSGLDVLPSSRSFELDLPEGARCTLPNCTALHVHHAHVSLRSGGAGATIDARNRSRHFDVAGGTLRLERVHLVNGGLQVPLLALGHSSLRHARPRTLCNSLQPSSTVWEIISHPLRPSLQPPHTASSTLTISTL